MRAFGSKSGSIERGDVRLGGGENAKEFRKLTNAYEEKRFPVQYQ